MADIGLQLILSELLGARKQAEEESPFRPVGDAADLVGKTVIQNAPAFSIKDNAVAGLLAGLTKGFSDNLTRGYADTQSGLASDYLLGGRSIHERPDGLSRSIYDRLQGARSIYALEREQAVQDANLDTRKSLLAAFASADTPQKQQRVLQMAKAFGVTGLDSLASPAEPIATPARPLLADVGPDLGVPSLADREKAAFAENLNAGMPATQAATSARAASEDLRKRTRDIFNPTLEKLATSISQTEDIVRKGEEGIAKAGKTGSAIASTYEKALSFFPDLFPEAAQQAEGDKLLELTRNLGASLNRIAGSGALSDFESKALFGTAMSPTNTEPQNQAVLRSYQNGLEIMKEHQGFLNYFMDKTGGSPEQAQTYWELYKQQNPILVKQQDGTVTPNPERLPWQKFDFVGAYKGYLSGEQPGAAAAPAAAGYSVDELSAAGYSPEDIAALAQQGLVKQ